MTNTVTSTPTARRLVAPTTGQNKTPIMCIMIANGTGTGSLRD
jgi:hypothetical protein